MDAEPKFTSETDIITALNWYSINKGADESKMWFEEWIVRNALPIPTTAGFYVGNIGFLCRVIQRGIPSTPELELRIRRRYDEWVEHVSQRKAVKVEKELQVQKLPKLLTTPVAVVHEISIFEDALMANYWATDKTYIQLSKYTIPATMPVGQRKLVIVAIKREIDYLDKVHLLDAEYKKCYPSLTHVKTLLKWLNSIIEVKAVHSKPKTQVPATKQVKDIAVRTDPEYPGTVAIRPERVIGCKYALMYNHKYRKLMYFESAEGFYAKGASFHGVSQAKSKTLRKPEKQLQGLDKMSKVQCLAFLDSVSGVYSEPSPRMSENVSIIQAWK